MGGLPRRTLHRLRSIRDRRSSNLRRRLQGSAPAQAVQRAVDRRSTHGARVCRSRQRQPRRERRAARQHHRVQLRPRGLSHRLLRRGRPQAHHRSPRPARREPARSFARSGQWHRRLQMAALLYAADRRQLGQRRLPHRRAGRRIARQHRPHRPRRRRAARPPHGDPHRHVPGLQQLGRQEPLRLQLDRRAPRLQGLVRPAVLRRQRRRPALPRQLQHDPLPRGERLRRHLRHQHRPARAAPGLRRSQGAGLRPPQRILVSPHARQRHRRAGPGHEPRVLRLERHVLADPLRGRAHRGLLQGRHARSAGQQPAAADHGHLAQGSGQPARERPLRRHVRVVRRLQRHGSVDGGQLLPLDLPRHRPAGRRPDPEPGRRRVGPHLRQWLHAGGPDHPLRFAFPLYRRRWPEQDGDPERGRLHGAERGAGLFGLDHRLVAADRRQRGAGAGRGLQGAADDPERAR